MPSTLLDMTEVMTCTFSLQLQTVMLTHTCTGLRLKTPMSIPAEEGQLHLGCVHSNLKAKLKIEMCKSHRLGSAKTNTGYYSYWKDLRPLVNKQTTNAFWNNNNLKFYKQRNVMRYRRTGTLFNQRHAFRYGFFPNANCPICPCTDSALHILSGCQHTKMRNMIIKRHNTASVLIVQALQRDHAEPTKLPTLT